MKLIKKISKKINTIFSRIPPEKRVKELYQYLNQEASSLDKVNSKSNFAVEVVEDPIYYGLISIISIDVRKRIESTGSLVVPRSFNSYVGTGFLAYVMRSRLVGWLISSQWIRISYRAVGEFRVQVSIIKQFLCRFI